MLSLHSILAHVELKQFVDIVIFAQPHFIQSDVVSYETSELVGRNLTQTIESGDFRVLAKFLYGFLLLLVGVAVVGLALLPYAEKWGLQDVKVSFTDKVGEELEEECEQKQTDVHTVNIGIGCHHNRVVAEVLKVVLNVEGGLKKVELLVLVYNLCSAVLAVERLATQ